MTNYFCRAAGKPVSFVLVVLSLLSTARAQNAVNAADANNDPNQSTNSAPLTITLQDALARARKNSPEYRAAQTAYASAKEDRVQGRAALLPGVDYNAGFLYNQGNGTSTGRYIGANGVHEYLSQGNVHQDISLQGIADYRRTLAAEAVAKARSEIAARGLIVTVVQAYYHFVVGQRKYETAQRATAQGQRFLDISQRLEKGGEVAHSDVIKAQIQFNQQHRDLQESELEMSRSRLELAVLIFPDFNEHFSVVDDLQTPEPLPAMVEVQTAAARQNPELRAALGALEEARHEVGAAWSGFLPSLKLDYFYGIDANHFATRQFDPASQLPVRNLGYAATATLQLPVWNWGANRSKLKQASLLREQAQVELTFAQRQLLAKLHTLYEEAQTVRSELDSLSQSAELGAESLRLTTLRYQAGEATVLEVVDAQNTATLTRNAFSDGQARYRVALANLQTLTGNF
jgi:outer membrane protein TolC